MPTCYHGTGMYYDLTILVKTSFKIAVWTGLKPGLFNTVKQNAYNGNFCCHGYCGYYGNFDYYG
jgi:hypothetical protein